MMTAHPGRMAPALAIVLTAAALGLAGCESARDGVSSGVMQSATGTAFGPKPAQTADFVTQSRPAQTAYMPVGVTPPAREIKPKTKAEVAAAEAEAAAQVARAAQEAAQTSAEGQRVLQTAPKPPKVEQ
jgi:hypothetical protein